MYVQQDELEQDEEDDCMDSFGDAQKQIENFQMLESILARGLEFDRKKLKFNLQEMASKLEKFNMSL